MHTLLPAVLAIIAAAMMAWGTVVRQRATDLSSRISLQWILGALIALVGFALQALALGLGSVLLVQPLIVLSVLFALPIERALNDMMISGRQWIWGILLAVGVSLFVIFAKPVPAQMGRQGWVLALVVSLLAAVLITLVVFAERSARSPSALLYGVVAGSLFGVAAVLINSLGHNLQFSRILSRPELYLIVVVGVAGVVAQQRAFGAGDVQASFPAMTVAEPIIAMAVSLAVFGQKLDRHSAATLLSLAGLALMVVGVLRLSKLSAAPALKAK